MSVGQELWLLVPEIVLLTGACLLLLGPRLWAWNMTWMSFLGALVALGLSVPEAPSSGIPVTYVPARNAVLLALALAWAETLGARHLFVGVNAVDYSGYPDCRPEFIAAFEAMANLATKAGVEGHRVRIHAPLINLGKDEIIRRGLALGVDYGLTVSCYQPTEQAEACGRCDSCRRRRAGFAAAGVADPTSYVPGFPCAQPED